MTSDHSRLHEYSLADLTVISDVALYGLPLGRYRQLSDVVRIRRAAVPENLLIAMNADIACSENEVLLHVPELARFLVRNGAEIVFDSDPTAEESTIHDCLVGTAFAILCHQRGILPLHSSVIDTAKGCVAFVGESGAGKSTLAAALFARNYQVVADDVSFVKHGDAAKVPLWPGLARLRLWQDALSALDVDLSTVEREHRDFDKYLLRLSSPKDISAPRHLSRIYHLQVTHDGQPQGIRRVQGASAIEILMQNVYRLNFAERMGRTPAIFKFCADLATRVPIFAFSRPMRFDKLHEGLDLLESHFCASLTGVEEK